MIGVAVVGSGYWGVNVIRNVLASEDVRLLWVCDTDTAHAQRALGQPSLVRITADLGEVLADPAVEAVLVATPVETHEPIGRRVLEAGRHLLMEKPLAISVQAGRRLVDLAESRGLVLMCDHTYCYTPAVERIRDLIADDVLGDIHYVDSVRINLGLVQRDVDVLWDLAPHDLSIIDRVLPRELRPLAVAAQGADPLHTGRNCIAYLTLQLPGDGIAHAHVNWLSPTKIRQFIIGGSKRTLLWDDLRPSQLISIFDRGVDLHGPDIDGADRRAALVSYRTGDMLAPALPTREALASVVAEFAAAIREQRAPATDGHAGLRVLEVLEAAGRSLAGGGSAVPLAGDPALSGAR